MTALGTSMHRMIMGLTRGDPRQIQHLNGNGLDNRKENLRIAPGSVNIYTMRQYDSRNYVGVKSFYLVYFSFWIQEDGYTQHAGPWFTAERAALHYDCMVQEINFPDLRLEKRCKIIAEEKEARARYFSGRGKSSFIGVTWRGSRSRWEARIRHAGKIQYIGMFAAEGDAARAYDNYVILHNLQRRLNFPELLLTTQVSCDIIG
jgi:hypothetical protein